MTFGRPTHRTSLARTVTGKFLLAGLVPLLAGVSLLVWQQRSNAESDTRQAAQVRATAAVQDLEQMFTAWRGQLLIGAQDAALRQWYSAPERRGEGRPEVTRLLVAFHDLYPDLIDEACFIDASGPELARQVKGTVAAAKDLSPDEGEAPFFAPTLALPQGKVHQNSPYISPDSGRWVVSNSTPILVGDRPAALLHFEANLDAVRARLAAELPAGAHARVVDMATGMLIADTRSTVPIVDQELAPVGAGSYGRTGERVAATELQPVQGNDNQWRVEVAVADAAPFTRSTLWVFGALVLIAVGCLVAAAVRFARQLVRPLARVTEVAEALAAGDLRQRTGLHRSDELGQAAVAVDAAAEMLAGTVAGIAREATQLATASEQLTLVSGRMAADADVTAGQAQQVAAAVETISGRMISASSAANEMGGNARGIASSAATASDVAGAAVELVGRTATTLSQLEASSLEVSDVVRVITSIAEQTNLLALNAAIEAVHSGEAGKGFAVVAGEVKTLARETAAATERISGQIAGMQANTTAAISAVGRIQQVIERVAGIQQAIGDEVEVQTRHAGRMSTDLDGAASSTSEIASNVNRVAAATRTTTDGAAQTRQAAGELAGTAASLQTLVNRFSLP